MCSARRVLRQSTLGRRNVSGHNPTFPGPQEGVGTEYSQRIGGLRHPRDA